MRPSHITPPRLLMNGLKQLFVSYKTVFVRDKSEFIRFVAQDKYQQATQIIYPDFLAASAQDKTPNPEKPEKCLKLMFVFHSTCPQCHWVVLFECHRVSLGDNDYTTIVCDAWQAGVGRSSFS